MRRISSLHDLILHGSLPAKLINIITLYRIFTFPVLLALLLLDQLNVFKWLLLISFLTDLIDGELARRYKITSILGAQLDSIGDDLTVLAAITGIFYWRFDFIYQQWAVLSPLICLYLVQLIYALIKFGKFTSFHTILAKIAAFLQGVFFCSAFFLKDIQYPLFYAALIVTVLDVIEEIILVRQLTKWKANVKGIFWLWRKSKNQ